jgi:chromosome partitioning protein
MRVIAIVSRKGGSGKTTLAGHLAVAAEQNGDGPVAIMDTDPQASLTDWWNARENDAPLFVQTSFDKLPDDCRKLKEAGINLLIIDTPPAISESIETCIEMADLVVIPSRPSPHDIRSVVTTVEVVEHLGKPLVFVLNAALGRAKITTEAITILSRHGPIAPVLIGQRVDFAASMTDGRTVMELPGKSKSSGEITALWGYLDARLSGNVEPLRLAVPRPKARPIEDSPLFSTAQSV